MFLVSRCGDTSISIFLIRLLTFSLVLSFGTILSWTRKYTLHTKWLMRLLTNICPAPSMCWAGSVMGPGEWEVNRGSDPWPGGAYSPACSALRFSAMVDWPLGIFALREAAVNVGSSCFSMLWPFQEDMGLIPDLGRSHAMEQLSPCTTTVESVLQSLGESN